MQNVWHALFVVVVLAPMTRAWENCGALLHVSCLQGITWQCFYIFQAVTAWEKAAELIVDRESLMRDLENFERDGSDPNRFFEKGNKGLSVSRLEEAKRRSRLYKVIVWCCAMTDQQWATISLRTWVHFEFACSRWHRCTAHTFRKLTHWTRSWRRCWKTFKLALRTA